MDHTGGNAPKFPKCAFCAIFCSIFFYSVRILLHILCDFSIFLHFALFEFFLFENDIFLIFWYDFPRPRFHILVSFAFFSSQILHIVAHLCIHWTFFPRPRERIIPPRLMIMFSFVFSVHFFVQASEMA